MVKKVIYISSAHLTDKISREYCIDFLIAKGIAVEYWDLTNLWRGEFNEIGTKITNYLCTFRTYSEVESRLRLTGNGDALYVVLFTYSGHFVKPFRLLSKYNCKMLFMAWQAMPIKSHQKWRGVLAEFFNPLQLAKKIYYKAKIIVYGKLSLVKQFDIVFAAGQACMRNNWHATKVVPINSIDYDQFIRTESKEEKVVEGRYAVFLDAYLPYHPDVKFYGKQAIKPAEYYASLDRFFQLLEAEYAIKVVIAAHPRASFSVEPFQGREVYYGQTSELVRDAEFVINHHSTSQSYAVLSHKPIIFIYTNEMVSLYENTFVSWAVDFAEYLDAAIYNIDKIIHGAQISIRDVNTRCYDNYKYSYLTARESEHATTPDIFFREISMI
jgi:hypothetical protein